jgi:hypothetical protein
LSVDLPLALVGDEPEQEVLRRAAGMASAFGTKVILVACRV